MNRITSKIAGLALVTFAVPLLAGGQTSGRNAQFISASGVPTSMTTGQTATVSLTFKNTSTGGSVWSLAAGYKLSSRRAADNMTWGLNRVALSSADSIPVGQQKTFTFSFQAPSTPGTYTFGWSMVKEGHEWLGDVYETPITVTSGGNTDGAQFISQSGVPATLTTGQTVAVSMTFKNTGSTNWTSKEGYELTSRAPFGNATWGYKRVKLPGSVRPGAQATFTFNLTAPSAPGTYTLAASMVKEGASTGFGDTSTVSSIAVLGSVSTTDPLDESKITTYDITLSGADWNAIVANPQDNTWRNCTVVWNGNETYRDVGIRGANGSIAPNYVSLSLKFDKFIKGQRLHAIDKLKLYSNAWHPGGSGPVTGDNTLMKNRIAYHVYRAMGVEAPRIPYCQVSINGGVRRLYNAEERIDREFFVARYGGTYNQAYKWTNYAPGGWSAGRDYEWLGDSVSSYVPFPFDMQIDSADRSGNDLIHLLNVVNKDPGKIPDVLDVDSFLRFMAVEQVVNDIDGYCWGWDGSETLVNNHAIYRNPSSNKFIFLKWDADHSYAVDAQLRTIFAHFERHILTRLIILHNGANRERYKAYIRNLIDGYHNTAAMWDRIDRVKDQIDAYVRQDPFRNHAEWVNAVNAMKTRIKQRNDYLNGQVP